MFVLCDLIYTFFTDSALFRAGLLQRVRRKVCRMFNEMFDEGRIRTRADVPSPRYVFVGLFGRTEDGRIRSLHGPKGERHSV